MTKILRTLKLVCQAGDVEKLQSLLKSFKYSPSHLKHELIRAVATGHLSIVEVLLQYCTHHNFHQILRTAYRQNNIEMIDYLVTKGVGKWQEVMHLACQHGNESLMREIMNRNDKEDIKWNWIGLLYFAALNNHPHIIRFISQQTAFENFHWDHILNGAMAGKHQDLMSYAIEHYNAKTDNLIKVVIVAVENDYLNVLKQLRLKQINDVQISSMRPVWTAFLRKACYQNKTNLVNWFIQQSVDSVNWNEGLIGACSGCHYEMAMLMILKGASDFSMGLVKACQRNKTRLIDLMIEYGADNWFDAIVYTCKEGNLNLVQRLYKNIEGMEVLHGHPIHFFWFLHDACCSGNLTLVQWLIEKRKLLDKKELFFSFKGACIGGHIDMIDFIVALYHQHNIECDYNAGLRYACANNQQHVIQKMIDLGANDWNGGMRVAGPVKQNINTIQWMIKLGGNDWNGTLARACANKDKNVIKWMFEQGADNWEGTFKWTCGKGNGLLIILIMTEMEKRGLTIPLAEGLKEACDYGNLFVVKLLAKRGVFNINTYHSNLLIKKGFWQAVRHNHLNIVQFIDSSTNLPEISKLHAFESACFMGHFSMIQYLCPSAEKISGHAFCSACQISLKAVKFLINQGFQLSNHNLNNAFKRNVNIPIMKFLIEQGADVQTINQNKVITLLNRGLDRSFFSPNDHLFAQRKHCQKALRMSFKKSHPELQNMIQTIVEPQMSFLTSSHPMIT